MIIIKGENEQDIVTRIEGALKGEDVDIFQSEEDITVEELLAKLADNANRSRVYVGRLERNTRRQYEEARELNDLMLPVALYFAAMVEEIYPSANFSVKLQRMLSQKRNDKDRARRAELRGYEELELGPKDALATQREIAKRLREEGKLPKE